MGKAKNKFFLTRGIEKTFLYLMRLTSRELSRSELAKSAIVFAPHPDDETLGCGGTVIRKIQADASVNIVFMTDGCRSHRNLIKKKELREMRIREATAAARRLGLRDDHVIFLGFENGKLTVNRLVALEKTRQILLRVRPEQIFIPYRLEPPPEHSITNEIVKSALVGCNFKPVIYEYPVWFWIHWPWVSSDTDTGWNRLERIKKTVSSRFGLRLLKEFRCSVPIGDILDLKRMALAEHRSQMMRINGISGWRVLSDIGDGQFLECFFKKNEIFHKCKFY